MALQVGFHISRKRIQGHFRDQVNDLEELRLGTGSKSRCAPFGTTPAAQNPQIWTKIDENHPPGVGGMGEAPYPVLEQEQDLDLFQKQDLALLHEL